MIRQQETVTSINARNELARQLRILREKAGLTQADLAGALNATRFQISRIECGRLPTATELDAMLDELGVVEDVRGPYMELWEQGWRPRRVRTDGFGGDRSLTPPASTTQSN
jgi:transcriptional regulator with XRE-family HTH domain